MHAFTAHRLVFEAEVTCQIEVNEHQGSAIRGAFYHALRSRFCAFSGDRQVVCSACALVATCPVATLVATLAPGHPRGQDRPRPYTIQPPLPGSGHPVERPDGHVVFRYDVGETLTFGMTIYANAMRLFPYVVLAADAFQAGGLGRRARRPDGRWRRGTLRLRAIWAEDPLTGTRQAVLRNGMQTVHVPDVPVTHAQVLEACRDLPPLAQGAPILATLHFLTPARLIHRGHLLKPDTFAFRPFFHRLIERLEALSRDYSETPLQLDVPALLEAAGRIAVVDNRLRWEEVASYSTRQRRGIPIGGLVGRVTLAAGDWMPFWPWLVWGQFTQVGKDAVKGDGMYHVMSGGIDATR